MKSQNLEAGKRFMFDARNPCRVCSWPPQGQGSSLWLDRADPGNQVRADCRETSCHLKLPFPSLEPWNHVAKAGYPAFLYFFSADLFMSAFVHFDNRI
jgi:hypothetical protein